mmetsp:Transcript_10232/g.41418  ORF Transcript_10232/g.41418 Transcript_10232/m.41418 type:complete len:103 (+) Transcript_10232:990-1298(+)
MGSMQTIIDEECMSGVISTTEGARYYHICCHCLGSEWIAMKIVDHKTNCATVARVVTIIDLTRFLPNPGRSKSEFNLEKKQHGSLHKIPYIWVMLLRDIEDT